MRAHTQDYKKRKSADNPEDENETQFQPDTESRYCITTGCGNKIEFSALQSYLCQSIGCENNGPFDRNI